MSCNRENGGNLMTHDDVWRAIERFAMEHGMSCSGLARCSGLDPTTFNRSKRWTKEGQPRWPSTNSISKILASTGASIQEFTKFIDNKNNESQNR
ncbi:MAG: helix-turn-helix transcriptional regulator [Alphaproteobacteria bacterium]|nr:helix-turn-helix transcriptional regulator [Alphaproteobacteria bacterium]